MHPRRERVAALSALSLTIADGPFRLPGLLVGNADDPVALTGTTALLFPAGARASVEVRGGAPGTREAAALDPLNLVPHIHGLLLTGGSAFGLDAAGGVMRFLEERGIGFPTPAALVPIVPAAVIYDLRIGDPRVRPDAAMGRRAAEAAREDGMVEGSVGAGRGATVGKALGANGMMRGGIGAASARLGTGEVVGALAVVNAFGDVVDPRSGAIVAGARGPGGAFVDTVALLAGAPLPPPYGTAGAPATPAPGDPPAATASAIENTTLVAVLTDAPLSKVALARVARMAHDGLARAIRPVHTQWDGDVVYAIATASDERDGPDASAVGAVAAEVVARAVVRAAFLAEGLPGVPGARDLAERRS